MSCLEIDLFRLLPNPPKGDGNGWLSEREWPRRKGDFGGKFRLLIDGTTGASGTEIGALLSGCKATVVTEGINT